MARPLRIEYPGALYHVTSRGNCRAPVYRDDGDRKAFLTVLENTARRFKWLCYAYCLMDNHYHLVVETLDGNLSRGMRYLNGVYTQRHNARHDATGHVFEGRYKAILVDKDSYLLEVCRYVALNPVRAGMVQHPAEWRWSSCRTTANGNSASEPWLHADTLLAHFGDSRTDAKARYRTFVEEGTGAVGNSLWDALKGGIVLGSDSFAKRHGVDSQNDEKLKEVPRCQRTLSRPELSELFFNGNENVNDISRALGNTDESIRRAYMDYGYSLKEIADFLRIHYSTVSRAVSKIDMKRIALQDLTP